MRRHELSGAHWVLVSELMPPDGNPGGRWRNHREVVNGLFWKLKTGVPWRDILWTCPEKVESQCVDPTQRPQRHRGFGSQVRSVVGLAYRSRRCSGQWRFQPAAAK